MKKNTGKAPSIQFYYKDFLADMAEHDPDIIGAWVLVLIKIWHLNEGGSVTKTLSQFSKIMNTDQVGARRFIDYFKSENIANVTEDNNKITIVNRRSKRDCKLREANRLRQQKHRDNTQSNTVVTPEKVNPSSSTSSSSSVSTSNTEKNKGLFDEFRKLYPGKKRGLDTEYGNFTKKHKDWGEVLPTLKASLENQIEERKRNDLAIPKIFNPHWKNLATWINGRFWEEDCGGEAKQTCYNCPATENLKWQDVDGTKTWFCPDCGAPK